MAKQTKQELERLLARSESYNQDLRKANDEFYTTNKRLEDTITEYDNRNRRLKKGLFGTIIASAAFAVASLVGSISFQVIDDAVSYRKYVDDQKEKGFIERGTNYKRYAEADFKEVTIWTDFDYDQDGKVDARIFQSIPCDWNENPYLRVFKNGDGSFSSTDVEYIDSQMEKALTIVNKENCTKEDIAKAKKIAEELSIGRQVDYQWSALSSFENKNKEGTMSFMYKLEPKENK